MEPKHSYVWYACYGSNIYEPRFQLYLKGGEIKGITRNHIGSRCDDDPLLIKNQKFPFELRFGYSAPSWQNEGVAFVYPNSKKSLEFKLYLIRKDQFEDVFAQENGKNPMTDKIDFDFEKLHKEKVLDIGKDESYDYYGRLFYLGETDGAPIYTFSTKVPVEDFPDNEPGLNYSMIIYKGLVQSGFELKEEFFYQSPSIDEEFFTPLLWTARDMSERLE